MLIHIHSYVVDHCRSILCNIYILVGGFNPSEKYLSNGSIIPNIWKNKTCSKPPTRYVYIYIDKLMTTSIILRPTMKRCFPVSAPGLSPRSVSVVAGGIRAQKMLQLQL